MPAVRKAPMQERSRAMVQTILDAATRVLVRDGVASFNTNRVAAVAGVSVGSLYQYFPNKVALLTALSERHVAQAKATLHAAMAQADGLPLAQIVPRVVSAFVDAHAIDPALHRVLSQVGDSVGAAGAEGVADLREAAPGVFAWIRALLEAHRNIVIPSDLDLATRFVMSATHALVHAIVIDADPPASLQAMQDEISSMILRYLIKT